MEKDFRQNGKTKLEKLSNLEYDTSRYKTIQQKRKKHKLKNK